MSGIFLFRGAVLLIAEVIGQLRTFAVLSESFANLDLN